MVEDRRGDRERGLVHEHAVEGTLRSSLRTKAARRTERRGHDDVRPNLVADDDERIVLGEVPRVSGEAGTDAGEKVLRTMQMEHRVARQKEAQ